MRFLILAATVLAIVPSVAAEDDPASQLAIRVGVDVYKSCVVEAVVALEPSCEPADDVAAAAVQQCAEVADGIGKLVSDQRNTLFASTVVGVMADGAKAAAVTQIVEARTKRPCP